MTINLLGVFWIVTCLLIVRANIDLEVFAYLSCIFINIIILRSV